jgi:hypothetical protein
MQGWVIGGRWQVVVGVCLLDVALTAGCKGACLFTHVDARWFADFQIRYETGSTGAPPLLHTPLIRQGATNLSMVDDDKDDICLLGASDSI